MKITQLLSLYFCFTSSCLSASICHSVLFLLLCFSTCMCHSVFYIFCLLVCFGIHKRGERWWDIGQCTAVLHKRGKTSGVSGGSAWFPALVSSTHHTKYSHPLTCIVLTSIVWILQRLPPRGIYTVIPFYEAGWVPGNQLLCEANMTMYSSPNSTYTASRW